MGKIIQFFDPKKLERSLADSHNPPQQSRGEREYWDGRAKDVMHALPALSVGQRIVVTNVLKGKTIRQIAESNYSTPGDISRIYDAAIGALRSYFKS